MSPEAQTEAADVQPMIPSLENTPHPASTKQAAGVVGGQPTNVMVVSFQDRILVTITQNGRLAQWVRNTLMNDKAIFLLVLTVVAQLHVPIESPDPAADFQTLTSNQEDALLPRPEFNATPLLGGRSGDWEVVGQLYACQIATAIAAKSPEEKRLLVVGLGLETPDIDRDIYLGIVDLVLQCL
ncbi:hypothetical protein TRV_07025 [Trichophyton verrucosum HKI 0517]|uniref:Proteasome assembly chaperone 3 n=1 Tax=Trichophyton verrucosum (strain HKI 0517) TaxID=663202 RepID=D4DIL5_TRIVH|nr:uncharacterized protein TRV_07025 [Trichophyton verrucosum HKI 0517]EFE38367.1 hypothetical protein TRV_07025 [Trichophyton verrucosum HKI 0517]